MIDESQLATHLSGYPQILKFTKWLDSRFNELFSHLKITLIPKGVPYMFMMLAWEIVHVEDEKITIKLFMYPAGFSMRYSTDIAPFKDEIFKKINEGILHALKQAELLVMENC